MRGRERMGLWKNEDSAGADACGSRLIGEQKILVLLTLIFTLFKMFVIKRGRKKTKRGKCTGPATPNCSRQRWTYQEADGAHASGTLTTKALSKKIVCP